MPETPTQDQLANEYTGQQIDEAALRYLGMLGESSLLWANGGSPANPCGFPGYGSPYLRSYKTYRWMLNHPVVRLVRSIATGPTLASYWQYKAADESVPQARVDLIQKMFDRIRQQSMSDIMRGRDYGWAGFEPIWDTAGGETRLEELKPLLPDLTTILVSKKGRFTGLQQASGEVIDLKADQQGILQAGLPAPFKAWVYTYDKECGNLHGRSWLENIRDTAWKDWLDCAQQIQKIGAKIAGTQGILKTPPNMKTEAIAAFKALSNGAPGMWLPSLAMNIDPNGQADMMKLLIDLSKTSLISLEVIDFGNTAPSIAAILDRMKHAEELMFAGGLRSSRTGLEGQHGTKAEAGVHTDTAMLVAELDDDEIAAQAQTLVDAVLELNFGHDSRGSVTIDPPPLVDAKSQRYSEFLTAISTGQGVAEALANYADIEEVFDGLDIPTKEGATFEIKTPAPVAPPAGNALHPRVAALSKRLGKRLSRK